MRNRDIMYAEKPIIHAEIMALNTGVNPYLSESMAPGVGDSVNPMQVVMSLGTAIWIAGMIGMLIYAAISYLRIKNKADVSLPVKAVLHYKKPAFWLVLLGVLACIVAAICFLADSIDNTLQVSEDKWDCTIHCAEESGENSYVITYSDEEILADTGCITFQNRNMFVITVHLIGEGKEVFVSEIAPGGNVTFMQADPEVTYTVGIHAVDEEEGNYFAQWSLIAEQKDIWVNYMDYANDLQQYTIADLDANGRLEVIVSSMGGTGSYTYTRIFEVNESFDGLTECTTDFIEGDSQPDMLSISGPGQVFRDLEGMFHYVIQDFMRAGTEYYYTIYSVALKEGHIVHQLLAQMHESYSTGSLVVEHTNTKGEKITEEEYLSAVETFFWGMSELTYVFDWRNLVDIEDADAEEIYMILSGIRSGILRTNEMMAEVPENSGA